MKKLKYGIIGTGAISEKHLQGYSKLRDDIEIVAACDVDENNLRREVEKYSIPNSFTDYRKLLAMDEIDFVSICLPNYLHAPVTIDALKAGKHVHCEKPMAINAAEAQKMVDVKNGTGKKLMIGLNNRFTPQVMYIKKYIDEGNLGEIYFAKCGWIRRNGLAPTGWFTDKSRSGGGPLIDLGVHFIDLVMYFMEYPKPVSVMAKTYCKFGNTDLSQLYACQGVKMNPGLKYDVEDLAAGFIVLSNDAGISFEISWASNTEEEKSFYEIYGTKSGVRFMSSASSREFKIFTRMNGQMADIEPKVNPDLYNESEFRHFINCIRIDKEPAMSLPEQGVEMMKLVDGIYRSAEINKQVIF